MKVKFKLPTYGYFCRLKADTIENRRLYQCMYGCGVVTGETRDGYSWRVRWIGHKTSRSVLKSVLDLPHVNKALL